MLIKLYKRSNSTISFIIKTSKSSASTPEATTFLLLRDHYFLLSNISSASYFIFLNNSLILLFLNFSPLYMSYWLPIGEDRIQLHIYRNHLQRIHTHIFHPPDIEFFTKSVFSI